MSKINRNSNSDRPKRKSGPSSYSDKKSDSKGRTSGGRSFKKSDDESDKKKSFRSGGKSFSRDERGGSGKSSFAKSKSSRSGASRSEGRPERKTDARSDRRSDGRFEEKKRTFGDKGAGAKRPFKKSFGGESSDDKKSGGRRRNESADNRSEGRRGARSFDKTNSRSEGKGSFSKDKPFRGRGIETDRNKEKSERIKKSFNEKKSFKGTERSTDFNDKPFGKRKPSETQRKRSFKELDKDLEFSTPPTYNLDAPRSKKSAGKSTKTAKPEGELIRLNKFIANSGVCSRRDADVLIQAGEVTVNGKIITELGYKVSRADSVKFNGQGLKAEKLVYVLLNKPKDFITTTDDPDERRTVMSLVKTACRERIYPVGRLDRQTTGLLLITNDGELAKKLTHPSHNITKVYQAGLDKPITEDDLEQLASGVTLEDGFAQFDTCAIVSDDKRNVGLEIHIGKNRIVRRMFEHLGYEVEKLDRVMYAGLTKKDLPRGQWRYLTEKEVIRLKHFLK